MATKFQQITVKALIDNAKGTFSPYDYAVVPGFHIYSDLVLNLRLSAAEDDKNSMRYLELLQDYAAVADACAQQVGADILEIQGERVHLLLPEESLTREAIGRLLAFSIAFTQTVYSRIEPKAGVHWKGFSLAVDFGPAVLLASNCGGGSLVSLGKAANRPAKKLNRGVSTGHCAIRRDALKNFFTINGDGDWVEINVLDPKDGVAEFANSSLTEKMSSIAKGIVETRRTINNIAFAKPQDIGDPATCKVTSPIRVRGIFLRCDLDGFSKQVDEAFAAGQDAIIELIQRFRAILNYPHQFIVGLNRPAIEFPWAGDCASLILAARNGEPVEDARKYLPVTAALNWHGQKEIEDNAKVRWAERLREAKWVIGIACGDKEEGSDGVILVANLEASGRTFRVAAGWSVKRALDAQETDGAKAEDTVLPNVDYSNLDTVYKKSFGTLDSRFMKSPYQRLKEAAGDRRKGLAKAPSFSVPNVAKVVPAARPYWDDRRRFI